MAEREMEEDERARGQQQNEAKRRKHIKDFDRQRTTLSGELLVIQLLAHDHDSHDAQLANSLKKRVYKPAKPYSYLSRYHDTCQFSSTHVPLSLPQTSMLTKEHLREVPLSIASMHSTLRASDSFKVAFLPALLRSQVHIQSLCPKR